MILAGEYLGNQALIDHGLFRLEGLCAHFERRGLLAEYNSGTYTAITLTSLLDVVECSQDATTREMAQACAERVLLDIFGHWHMGLGCSSGPKSRAYLPDADNTQSIMPGLMWYLTGDPLIINPMDSLSSEGVGITLHHGPSPAFMMANIAELFSPSYDPISPAVLEFCRAERTYPHQLLATSDSGKTSYSLLRTYQQPKWGLGTSSCAMWGPGSGHNLTLHGVLTQKDEPTDWRGRVSFWHYMFSEYPDLGDRIPSGYDDTMVETTSMQDPGQYHTAQQAGSALVLGNLGTGLIGKETKKLRFQMAFSLLGTMPDEMLVNDTPLAAWEGDASAADWHFLRFGQVFVGLRMAGMLKDAALPVRRELRAGYLRVEIPIVESPTVIDEEFQAWLDLGYVLEIADASECSFAEFRQQCQAATWEYFHAFYRNSRYIGRHGELQIVDSIVPNTLRFIAVDGTVEEMPRFTATGLDPAAVQLFADGHIVRQRRLLFRPQFAGSPFYNSHNHVLAADIE
jgi:hypothetical protein